MNNYKLGGMFGKTIRQARKGVHSESYFYYAFARFYRGSQSCTYTVLPLFGNGCTRIVWVATRIQCTADRVRPFLSVTSTPVVRYR